MVVEARAAERLAAALVVGMEAVVMGDEAALGAEEKGGLERVAAVTEAATVVVVTVASGTAPQSCSPDSPCRARSLQKQSHRRHRHTRRRERMLDSAPLSLD